MKNNDTPWTFGYVPNRCPCYCCQERSVDCHGKCEKYKEWQETRPKPKKTGFNERYYK